MSTETHEHEHACARCGASMDEPGYAGLCNACAISAAEDVIEQRAQQAVDPEEARDSTEVRKRRMRVAISLAVSAVCIAIIAVRAPMLIAATAPEPPKRSGPVTTAGDCDGCVTNLWKASVAVRSGAPVPIGLYCPASAKPYVVDKSGEGLPTISCPNPGEHDLAELKVTPASPIPEAVAP